MVTKRTSTRLMIGLRSADLLASLQPNLEELKRIYGRLRLEERAFLLQMARYLNRPRR